jgi:hypothetical protein
LGCMGMSEFYGPGDERESIRPIRRALEPGINFLDTADIHGLGCNEELGGEDVFPIPGTKPVMRFSIVDYQVSASPLIFAPLTRYFITLTRWLFSALMIALRISFSPRQSCIA